MKWARRSGAGLTGVGVQGGSHGVRLPSGQILLSLLSAAPLFLISNVVLHLRSALHSSCDFALQRCSELYEVYVDMEYGTCDNAILSGNDVCRICSAAVVNAPLAGEGFAYLDPLHYVL